MKNNIAMTPINFATAGTFMFFQLLTSITTRDIEFWSDTISHYRALLRMHSLSLDVVKLACTRMDLLAQGMGVDRHEGGGVVNEVCRGGFGVGMGVNRVGEVGKRIFLDLGSAEEWIARQGHEGMLFC